MFLGTAHEQAHALPYAQNIGAHLLVFKDFIAKYDVKNVEFFALAAPAGWDVPKRTVGFGQSGATAAVQRAHVSPARRRNLSRQDDSSERPATIPNSLRSRCQPIGAPGG